MNQRANKVNFFAAYDGEEEDGPVPHVLEASEYATTDDSEYDSWLLLDRIEAAAAPPPEDAAPTEVPEAAGQRRAQRRSPQPWRWRRERVHTDTVSQSHRGPTVVWSAYTQTVAHCGRSVIHT